MHKQRSIIKFDFILYFVMFFSLVIFQATRIMQIELPTDIAIPQFEYSYLFYGIIIFLLPLYLIIFIYLPSLLILNVNVKFLSFRQIRIQGFTCKNIIYHSQSIKTIPIYKQFSVMRC